MCPHRSEGREQWAAQEPGVRLHGLLKSQPTVRRPMRINQRVVRQRLVRATCRERALRRRARASGRQPEMAAMEDPRAQYEEAERKQGEHAELVHDVG